MPANTNSANLMCGCISCRGCSLWRPTCTLLPRRILARECLRTPNRTLLQYSAVCTTLPGTLDVPLFHFQFLASRPADSVAPFLLHRYSSKIHANVCSTQYQRSNIGPTGALLTTAGSCRGPYDAFNGSALAWCACWAVSSWPCRDLGSCTCCSNSLDFLCAIALIG